MPKFKPKDAIWRQVLEFRYDAWFEFADRKGKILDALIADSPLKNWSYSELRIDMADSKQTDEVREKGFLSFTNCGYECILPATRNYFADRAAKFLESVDRCQGLEVKKTIRLGVRTQAMVPCEGNFHDLLAHSMERVFTKQSPFVNAVDMKTLDVSTTLESEDADSFVRLISGPMASEQAKTIFIDATKVPPLGYFMDVDVATKKGESAEFSMSAVIASMRMRAKKAQDIIERAMGALA
jgi:hypothetical protein